jgi:hypothetical protein
MRGVAADAQRFTGSLLNLFLDVPAFFQNTIVLTTKSLVPIPVPVSRANAYSGGVLARALPESTLSVDLSLAELRQSCKARREI